MKNMVFISAALFLAAAAKAGETAQAQPLVGPLAGSELHHYESFDFGRYNFVTGPEKGEKILKSATIEGKKSSALYKDPKKTTFEIFSAYRRFLQEKGYDIVYSCEAEACGEKFKSAWYELNQFESNPNWDNSAPITAGAWEKQFYIAALKKGAGGDTYVSIYTNTGWWNHPVYRVDVARPAPLGAGVVEASKIAETMKSEGRMSFYGITFDTGSSAIKKESGPVLAEIASFLKGQSGDYFYVTGHTDDEGDLKANMKLSEARAEAVVKDLAGRGVKSSMLSAYGAGPLSPVATNFTLEGRALNRRVEIVRRLASSSRAILPEVPDFDVKQDAVQAAQGGTGASPAAAQAQQSQAQQALEQQQAAQQQIQAAQQQAAQAAAAAAAAAQAAKERAESELVPVPNVVKMWLTPGTNLLAGQGFKVNRLGRSAGIIQKQDPAPNTRVKKGSTVTITVGK